MLRGVVVAVVVVAVVVVVATDAVFAPKGAVALVAEGTPLAVARLAAVVVVSCRPPLPFRSPPLFPLPPVVVLATVVVLAPAALAA